MTITSKELARRLCWIYHPWTNGRVNDTAAELLFSELEEWLLSDWH